MPSRVIHFEIQADNIERAKSFYEKVFGWKIEQMQSPESGGMAYWGLTTGPDGTAGINGGMYVRPKKDKITTYDCTIQVDDMDEALEAVQRHGGTVQKEKSEIPGVGWFGSATDPEGNIFGLMQPNGWKVH